MLAKSWSNRRCYLIFILYETIYSPYIQQVTNYRLSKWNSYTMIKMYTASKASNILFQNLPLPWSHAVVLAIYPLNRAQLICEKQSESQILRPYVFWRTSLYRKGNRMAINYLAICTKNLLLSTSKLLLEDQEKLCLQHLPVKSASYSSSLKRNIM